MKIFKRKNLKMKKVLLGALALALVVLPALVIAFAPIEASAAVEIVENPTYVHSPELTYTNSNASSAGEYLAGSIASNSQKNYKYVFGKPDGWKTGDPNYYSGIDYAGFEINGGNVLFEINSCVTMRGPIHVNGGNLIVRIAEGALNYYNEGHALFKRHVAADLRNSEDYIPVNASGLNASGATVHQYSGALFVINKGTVEIVGGAYNSSTGEYNYLADGKYAYISGAGQFSMSISENTLETGGFVFPATYGTDDDVQAEGPLFLINDKGTDSANNHATVRLYHVSLRHNYNANFSGGTKDSDGNYLPGEEPHDAASIEYVTKKGTNATYGKRPSSSPFPSTVSMISNGGAMYVDGAFPQVYMVNSDIQRCYSEMSSAAIHFTGSGGDVDLVNTNIFECITQCHGTSTGATMRAMGSNKTNFSLTGCEVYKNWSKTTAGAINWGSMNTSEPLTITNCTIRDNASSSGYAALNCASRLTLLNTKITGNMTLTGYGGGLGVSVWNSATSYDAFKLEHDATVTIGAGVEISGNKAARGGAIYLTSYLIKVGTNFKNDPTSNHYREFPTKGYYDENNEFVSTGAYNVSLYISEDAVIKDNIATGTDKTAGDGGAIYMTRDKTAPEYIVKLYMQGGTIQNNTAAANGGACYLTGNNLDFVMTGGTITENESTKSGGALYINDGGNFEMSAGEISYNTSGNNAGGVAVNNGNFEMSGGQIKNNTATSNGGGVTVYYGNFEMTGGTISDNQASSSGGGVYVQATNDKPSDFEMTGGTIENNTAYTNGGGVSVYYGDFTMSGGTITKNKVTHATTGYGGGVYLGYGNFEMTNGTISENTSSTNGGGVLVEATSSKPAEFRMSGGVISGNVAANLGGGVRVGHGSFIMSGGTITANKTTHASEGRGGGVSINYGNFEMSAGTVSKNFTSYRGGGIEVRYGSFLMTGGMIGGDTAADANYCTGSGIGGGVCVWGDTGDFEMTGGYIKNNYVSGNSGGGVYISGGDFLMWKGEDGTGTGGEISYNYSIRGGGLYVYQGDFVMSAGLVDHNYATNNSTGTGGGIWVYKGDFIMSGGSFTNNYTTNTSGGHGGAVCVQAGTFTMSGGDLTGNYSAANGGAVAVLAEMKQHTTSSNDGNTRVYDDVVGSFTMTGGTISGNGKNGSGAVKTKLGGAVYVAGGDFEMTGGTISGNFSDSHGGAVYLDERTITIRITQTSSLDANNKVVWSNGVKETGTVNGNFTMSSGTISGNTAGTSQDNTSCSGGGVYVFKGNFAMSGGNIESNLAYDNAGGVYVHIGSFTMSGESFIKNNQAPTDNAGGVYVYQGNFIMNNGTISGNTTKYKGGGVYVVRGTFTMNDGTISGNSNTSDCGGGVYVHTDGGYVANFFMNGGIISGNTTPNSGGGVYVNAANFTMTAGTISGNTANATGDYVGGGGVFVESGNFIISVGSGESCLLEENNASKGGAVFVSKGNFTITVESGEKCEIKSNTATVSGGAVYVYLGNFEMTGTTENLIISHNTAEDGHGGAVYVRGNGTKGNFIMNGGKITENKGTEPATSGGAGSKGGAVFVYLGSFTMNDGELSNNVAGREGGAVFVDGNGTYGKFIMKNGTISGNTSSYGGGAVYVWRGNFEMENGNIINNIASGSGGAIRVSYGNFKMENGTLSGNFTNDHGGAVYVEGGTFSMANGTVSNNYAYDNGGAVYVKVGTYQNVFYSASFTMTGGSISSNGYYTDNGNPTVKTIYGGAVCVVGANFYMTGGTLYDNRSTNSGGAVYIDYTTVLGEVYYGNFEMDYDAEKGINCLIDSNKSGNNGGAVYVNYGNFTMSGSTTTAILSNNTAVGWGGGVYVNGDGDEKGVFTLKGGKISGNRGTTVKGNNTGSKGGGVAVYHGKFVMMNGEISDNFAEREGGAVFLDRGSFEMYNGKISGNRNNCDLSGGAIYVFAGDFKMYNGEISGNSAPLGSAGAVCVDGGNFTIYGGTITRNTSKTYAGAIAVRDGGNFIMTSNPDIIGQIDIVISHNYTDGNGGAVHVSNGNFTMDRGTLEYNGRKFTVNGATVTAGDAATVNGGAVYISLGNFTMSAGLITNNGTTSNGGAVYLLGDDGDETGIFTMTGGTISSNHANGYAGAVYVLNGIFTMSNDSALLNNSTDKSGGAVTLYNGSFTMNSGSINGNTAPEESGGAIYIDNGSFYMLDGTISGNSTENNGGAVALGNGNFEMYGGTISGNSACWGGAIHVTNGNFTMSNGTISGNYNIAKAGANNELRGGAVLVIGDGDERGVFAFNGGIIENNGQKDGVVTTKSGGAVYVERGNFIMGNLKSPIEAIMRNNVSTEYGGAVYVDRGNFRLNSGTITGNGLLSGSAVVSNGGAISIVNGSFYMYGGTISNNAAKNNGGAVQITTGDFTMSAGALSGNTARWGGAVHLAGGTFTMSGDESTTVVSGNTVTREGGAIFVSSKDSTRGKFVMNGGLITENTNTSTGNDDGAGAVFVFVGDFEMTGGTISNNTCGTYGGAVFVENGNFTMSNGTIANNKSSLNGGAVYVKGDATNGKFTMNSGTLIGNSAEGHGGAVYVSGGDFTMYDGTITENYALQNGGAVTVMGSTVEGKTTVSNNGTVKVIDYNVIQGNFTMYDGIVSNNGYIVVDGEKVIKTQTGGAIAVFGGKFEIKSGTVTGNCAANKGGAIYIGKLDNQTTQITQNYNGSNWVTDTKLTKTVSIDSDAIIGVEGCYGDANLDDHTSCPVFTNNSATHGGAIALYRVAPTFHCGSMIGNTATDAGGAVYVTSGSLTINYAIIERNSANIGGGVYVETQDVNRTVAINSGVIMANTANRGGGIAIKVTGKGIVTMTIGLNGCDGSASSSHKHPNISGNIATLEGGGLSLESVTSNGISFTMYCGVLTGNVANQNVPTGNVLQEGGTISISGTYQIDNVTVVNGTYLRPGISDKTVNIVYYYEIKDPSTGVGKTTVITVAVGESDLMKINLPSALPEYDNGETYILVRWARKDGSTYECGSQYTINDTIVNGLDTIEFYAVWILQGTGFAETPIVSPEDVYSHKSNGLAATIIEMSNPFTVQFAVSDCDPSKFDQRILTINEYLKAGTTIIMIDLTTSGTKSFYYYTVDGTEREIDLTSFVKLGSPSEHWRNKITNTSNNTVEEFLFIFDFTKTAELYSGALQITLTRTYVNTGNELAPIIQVGSCSILDSVVPEISVPDEEYLVADEFEIVYTPGFISDNEESIFYGSEVSLVFTAVSGKIPTESYLYDGTNKYYVNRSGSIIVPLGAATEEHSIALKFISPYLVGRGEGIELKASLRVSEDSENPLASQQVHSIEVVFGAKPKPSVDIKIDTLVYYVDALPEETAISVTELNTEGYTFVWSVYEADGNDYIETELISVSENGTLTFADEIGEGVYRIKISVIDEFGNTVTADVQNIAILTRASTMN